MKYYYLKKQKGIFYYLKNHKRRYGYRFTYYDLNHKRHERSSRGFHSKKEAIQKKIGVVQRYGKLKNSSDMTFGKWCEIFLTRIKPEKKITTYKSYYNLLHHDVLPYMSQIKLIDIRPIDYKYNCLTRLLKNGLSRKTVMDINARVQTVMNDAVKNGYLVRNRLAHTRVPNINQKPKKQILNDMQLRMFNSVLGKQSIQIQAIYGALEDTGMRAGELLGLHWKDIDLVNQLIKIKYTRDEYGLRSPKTARSKRTIMFPRTLRPILAKYYQICRKKFHVNQNSLVILGKAGKPLIPNLVSIKLKSLLIKAGLGKMVGRFTPHSFRHMIVSRLINAGIKPTAVSKMMGHASVNITLSIYAQSAPNEILNMDKAMKEINKEN